MPTVDRECHYETLCISAKNVFVNIHKQEILEAINNEMFAAPVIDILPKTFTSQIIKKVFDQNKTDTRGLAGDIKIKVYSSVMLTVNVELSERLVNGPL